MNLTVLKAYCNACGGERNHALLHRATRTWDYVLQHGWTESESAVYEMIQCCGCDEIKLKLTSHGPYPEEDPTYYPPSVLRKTPEWLDRLAFEAVSGGVMEVLCDLVSEIYRALQNNMPRLAAMGVRAALEAMMLDKVGDQGTFDKNLNEFASQGHVAKNQSPWIESVLDVGSATIHRGYSPPKKDVIAMLELTENLIQAIYIHGDDIREVAARTPPRPPRLRGKPADAAPRPARE